MRLRARQLVLPFLLLALVGNTWGLATSYLRPFRVHYLGLAGRSAIERSARLSFGDDFAGYILFLRTQIPSDALVIQPTFQQDQTFGHNGLMQYFLFPRQVLSCPREITWDSCMARYAGPGTYILALDGFPPGLDPSLDPMYVGYESGRGVIRLGATLGALP